MADRNDIMRERQRVMAREMQRRGISLKAVSLDSETPYQTVRSYFPGERDAVPAVMSTAAQYKFIESKALPTDIISLMLPDGYQVVRVPEEIDHDELCSHMQKWLHEKAQTHHPDSPGGREITPCEDEKLRAMAARLRVAA